MRGRLNRARLRRLVRPHRSSSLRPTIGDTPSRVTSHLFQFSLRSRCTAMLAGLRLDPGRAGTGSIVPPTLLETMPSAPSRQACSSTVEPSSATCSLSRMPARLSRSSRASAVIMLDQVERVQDRLIRGLRRRSSSNRDKPSGPSTTASPSIVKLLALIRSAADVIAINLAVQS